MLKRLKPGEPESASNRPRDSGRLPKGIWALGFVSMFMDVSSELVHSLLPVFMTSVLGASITTIGVVEGTAEGAAAVSKVFSGTLSDYFGKRKPLAVAGYALAAMTKPVFALATTIGWVFGARFVDRIGKGIRGAPRDALVADIAPPQLRGAAYGLRQSLDSLGAFVGPLLAMIFMIWLGSNIQSVLWISVAPAFFAVLLLIFGVREPAPASGAKAPRKPLSWLDTKRLPLPYWLVVAMGFAFTLARFSEAFLILRARSVGFSLAYVPAVMIVMNAVYSIFAYPAGAAADRVPARALLTAGLGLLVAADMILAMAASAQSVLLGSAFWGLHMAFTQGLFAKLVADAAPVALRGTAFGIYNLSSGAALLLASLIAGVLWDAFGPAATFFAGALFAAVAATGLLFYRPVAREPGRGEA